jgi:hypothetical protein
MRTLLVKHAFILILALLLAACERGTRTAAGAEAATAALPPAVAAVHYPPGRWRLANPVDLGQVVLWASQIVIRHRDSRPSPAFNLADWASPSRGGQRSREEAFAIAERVRAEAARDPSQFADLVARYSEDVGTQPVQGSLGGMPAAQFMPWPEVLDALAATPMGEVSQPVETVYGFHVFHRRPPPAESEVTGAEIVISHDDAGWIRILGRGEVPRRSRADALALATQLYERAKASPEEFSQLVSRYSEHRDAERGGDMGTWSTREPTFYPREVEILSGLAVGEIAPPLDSHVGFRIIKRLPHRVRDHFAMAQVRLPFDDAHVAPDPLAKESVFARATELALQLRKAPARFSQLQREFCCTMIEDWMDGRGSPALTSELSQLEPGQISARAVQSENSYVIVQRVDPPIQPPMGVSYQLPEPVGPDINYLLGSRDGAFMRAELQRLGQEVLESLGPPDQTMQVVVRLHKDEARFEHLETWELRVQAFRALQDNVKALLEPDAYERYLALLNSHFEQTVLLGG